MIEFVAFMYTHSHKHSVCSFSVYSVSLEGARGFIWTSHHCNPTPAHIWLLGSVKWTSDYSLSCVKCRATLICLKLLPATSLVSGWWGLWQTDLHNGIRIRFMNTAVCLARRYRSPQWKILSCQGEVGSKLNYKPLVMISGCDTKTSFFELLVFLQKKHRMFLMNPCEL